MITLHHVPLARSFRVLWILEELGLDYELRYYSIRDGSMRSPEFLTLSPAGRVPVLEHQDGVWFESGAIVQLLCETYPEAGLLPAAGGAERARALEMFGYGFELARYYVDLDAYPRLVTYWERLRARPAYIRAKARDGVQDIYAQEFYPVPEGA